MVAIAQGGMLGFAPQYAKGSTPTGWQYHKASAIDISALDDQRVGPPEIGGRPLPTIPYKGGVMTGGGFSFNPRLENSMGWLLYATMGYKTSSLAAINPDGLKIKTLITGSSSGSTTYTINADLPTTYVSGKVSVRLIVPDSSTYAPTAVVVSGSNVAVATTETFNFSTGSAGAGSRVIGIKGGSGKCYETIIGGSTFTHVDTISIANIPTADGSAYFEVGYEDSVAKRHLFELDPSDPTLVKWLAFRKYIPSGDGVSTNAYGEQYTDCKPVSMSFTLPNDGLINAQVGALGRGTFAMVSDPFNSSTGAWNHGLPTTEDYLSVPIGCNLNAGYIRIPFFSATDLPVVGGQFSIGNAPADPRQLRVFGSPYLYDIPVVSRGVSYDIMVLWENPELYRYIHGNAKNATEWSGTPFTTRVDLMATSPTKITGSNVEYSLQVESKEVMLAIQGGIQLAGNNVVAMRLSGPALDVSSGSYTQVSLVNKQSDYTWPAA